MAKQREGMVKGLRAFRVYHKYIGLVLAIIFALSALTGIFLAWKKNVGWIQPPTHNGVEQDLSQWLPLYELKAKAEAAFWAAHPDQPGNVVDRIDVQPNKGMAKMLLADGWWEVQIDGKTGEVFSIARRHSDWIEALHDLSLISDGFKLVSMNILGLGLLLMVGTGLWLWYGPRRLRALRKKQ